MAEVGARGVRLLPGERGAVVLDGLRGPDFGRGRPCAGELGAHELGVVGDLGAGERRAADVQVGVVGEVAEGLGGPVSELLSGRHCRAESGAHLFAVRRGSGGGSGRAWGERGELAKDADGGAHLVVDLGVAGPERGHFDA